MWEILAAIKQMLDLRENEQKDRSNVFKEGREKIIYVQNLLEQHNELEETELYGWATHFYK